MHIGRLLSCALVLVLAAGPLRAQVQSTYPQNVNTEPEPSVSGTLIPPRLAEEEVPRGQTVADRPRPDYDPIGLRVGSFTLLPDLESGLLFNSNILGQTQAISDYIFTFQPSMDLKSDWNTNALNFHADGTFNQYVEHHDQNFNDYSFASDGRLDIDHSAYVFGGIGYSVRHQPVSSPNNLGNVSPALLTLVPAQYSDLAGRFGGEKDFNRLSFRLDTSYDAYDFADVPGASGVIVPYHLENYNEEQVALRTAYELAPLRKIYILTKYDIRNHDFSSDLLGFNRNSTGYTIAAGANYDLTGVTFIDAYAGYFQQDYKDPRLATISGPAFAAKLTWNVTRLTTISGSVTRGVAESDLPGVSGYITTLGEVHADHELLRNVLLRAAVGYEQDSFVGIDGTDHYYLAGGGAKYLINRNFALSLDYAFQYRTSSFPNSNYSTNIISLHLSSHF